MEHVALGNSELGITRLGLGAWAIGGPWKWGWGRQSDQDSVQTIHASLDAGINWIDTAPVYGLGRSESVVGNALRTTAHTPYIFTKCGLVWDTSGNVMDNISASSIRNECEESLRRLGVDTIDLYQIHWPRPDEDIEEAWTTMAELKEEGKVRHIGVSNFNVDQMERAGAIAPVTSLQPPYSLVRRGIEEKILPFCLENEIGTLAYSTMASGLLSGKMSRERIANLPDDDWRKSSSWFNEPDLARNLELAGFLGDLGRRHDVIAGAIAIAWALLHPGITAAIVGLRKPEQVQEMVAASQVSLSVEEIDALSSFLD
ncbi:MAG: aldo/keto reductase [Rhodothermales bacterium]|nr:aldo/keto reductase [Rhodothermales bacterium]